MESSCSPPPPPRPLPSDRDRPFRSLDPKRPSLAFPSRTSSPRLDNKDRGDPNRDPWRKGFAADRGIGDGGDDNLERGERARNSLRKVQWHERAERHYVSKLFASERDRSERSDSPRTPSRRSLEHDRDHFDKIETTRSSVRRGYGGDYSRQTTEGSTHSPLQDERDLAGSLDAKIARKGSGYDLRADATLDSSGKCSPSSELDGQEWSDPRRSPSRRGSGTGRDVKDKEMLKIPHKPAYGLDRDVAGDVARASPRKDIGLEKEGTRTPKLSPRKFWDVDKDGMESQMPSPRKAFGSDWTYRASPKSKGRDEGGTRTWNRSIFSRQDDLEDRKLCGRNASQEEVWRKISPDTPAPFLHIAKRIRSDRDRGKREDSAKSQSATEVLAGCGKTTPPLDTDPLVKEGEAVHGSHLNVKEMDEDDEIPRVSSGKADVRVAQSDDSYLIKAKDQQKLDSSSSPGEKSEMEEGELEPEDEAVEEQEKESETMDCAGGTSDNKIGKENDCVDCEDHVTREEATCDGKNVDIPEVESQPNGEECRSPKPARSDDGESSKMLNMKEEQGSVRDKDGQRDLHLQCKTAIPSTLKNIEADESSKGGLTLDLLHERTSAEEMRVKDWGPNRGEKGLDPSRDLSLSLFMRPAGTEAESSKQRRSNIGNQSALHEKLESSEQLQKVQSMPAGMNEDGLGGRSDELGERPEHDNKQKREKIESLQLSLALPGMSMAPLDSNAPYLRAEPQRSFQSLAHTQTENLSQTMTRTNSDGFTTSFSFSQSHSFVHNPSCSLNCTSLENQELSCGGSRQVSLGNEQMCHRSLRTQSGNEQMSNGNFAVVNTSQDRLDHRRGFPHHRGTLQNGSIQSFQGFPSVTGSNRSSGSNQISQGSHQIGHRFQIASKKPVVSSQDIEGFERQGDMHKEFPDRQHQQDVWLASNQQVGFRENRPMPHLQPESERRGEYFASPAKRFSSLRNEDTLGGRNVINEKIGLREVATEPIAVMAQKLQELPDSFLEGLKDLVKEMLGSIEKREEFISLQESIRKRQDLTEETLLRAHRTQLEIFVSLKTGMQAFVQQSTTPLTYKALIEIFLQTKCRNIDCQLPLPVDACECRICSQKSGFCHECMCVVCCKFDSDSHTCRWVGCDFCSHWCHADCALRMSYIAPAPSTQGTIETSEMQFQCVACGRHTELFGFVKAVFHKCSDVWGPETLAKELDCVRKIFHGSKDMRGKQLCWKAEQMLQKLENKVGAAEVSRSMLRFFNEGNAELDGACTGNNKKPYLQKPNEALDGMSDPAREAMFKMPPVSGNKLGDMDNASAALQTYEREHEEKRTEVAELQYDRARKRAEIEDLESIVWIKQAESKMFQMRADEARQDASGLQRIASVKLEKIEKDYACKYAKLRLNEAEERRRKRVEELQALERAQHDYQRMKIRMEADIKNLLMKMEVTKKQFF